MFLASLLGCVTRPPIDLDGLQVRVVTVEAQTEANTRPGETVFTADLWVRSAPGRGWLIVACPVGAPTLLIAAIRWHDRCIRSVGTTPQRPDA